MESAVKTIKQLTPDTVPSLLIPLAGSTLLVPTVTVAEMVVYQPPQPVDHCPDWLLGNFLWREQQVPLLSLEVLTGAPSPKLQPKSRVAVLNHTGISADLPFIALLTQGLPRLVRVAEGDILAEPTTRSYTRLEVSLEGEHFMIPDISALERTYLNWRQNN